MAEIDRVYLSIDAHFKCFGNPQKYPDEIKKLTGTIVKCVMGAIGRYSAREEKDKDEALEALISKAECAVRVLDAAAEDVTNGALVEDILVKAGWDVNDAKDIAKNPFAGETNDKVLSADNFKTAATLAMVARRALLPLDGEQPWDPPIDPAVALRDDDDPYSFSIFDTLVEPIQDLLPPLYQLSTEGWTPSGEEACENAATKLDGALRGVVKELVGVTADEDKLIVFLMKKSAASSKLPATYEGFPVIAKVIGGMAPVAQAVAGPVVKKAPNCPICNVAEGTSCITASGKRAKQPHRSRVRS